MPAILATAAAFWMLTVSAASAGMSNVAYVSATDRWVG
jgi:hypothetical protein